MLDTDPEAAFDEVASLAAEVCDAPIALVSFVDRDRQWFKAEKGLGVRETPRAAAVCAHAILQEEVFVVPDTMQDSRFADNPLVTGSPHMRFYAGAPIRTSDGLPLGTVCVLDTRPRPEGLNPRARRVLQGLARQVVSELELRRALAEHEVGLERLREREAHLSAVVEQTTAGVSECEASGRFVFVNDRFCEIVGRSREELLSMRMQDITHPDDLGVNLPRFDEAMAKGRPFEIEKRYIRPDGSVAWVKNSIAPLRLTGAPLRLVAVTVDITQMKAAEEDLLRLNRELEQGVEDRTRERDRLWRHSQDILAVVDYDGRLASINPAFTRILGWSEQELIGRPVFEFIHPDDHARTLAELENLVGGGTTLYFENRYRARDGRYRWLSWMATPDEGLIYATARDVTEQKASLEALKKTEEQLRHSQKMEAVGQLTGGVAHDFNNLLQVIGGNLQLLSREVADSPSVQKRLQSALAAVSRGAKLASQLLAFGRKQPLEPRIVNLGKFLRSMDDMLRRALGEEVEVETIVSGGLWNTLVDPSQVENAILNLALNARDAMGGGGKLTIEAGNAYLDEDYAAAHHEVTAGQYVMVAVSDTGCGMSAETVQRVFEPFFTTKPEGKGTGLGLSMVYGFIKQSGGHIKIYSEPGQGTTVKLYLPRTHQSEEASDSLETGSVEGGAETILVVEDDEDVRETVVAMLAELGYRVLKAKDASSGLAIIESGIPVDLLFTDVVMPGELRSTELARRAKERHPEIAILFTSGYTANAIVHGGRLDPGVALLTKPYTREALARKVRHVLGNQAQKSQPADVELSSGNAARAASAPPMESRQAAAKPLTVLLLEDDPAIRATTSQVLQELGHTVVEADSLAAATVALQATRFDVLLLDVELPDGRGPELGRMARANDPAMGLVFMSGAYDEEVAAIEGALSLRKPYTPETLVSAIERASTVGAKPESPQAQT